MTNADTLLDRAVDFIYTLDLPMRRKLAQFLGVQDQTIRSWQRRKTIPSGVRAVKLHYLLEMAGYGGYKWRCSDPVLQEAGRLVAFRVVELDDIVRWINDPSVGHKRAAQMLMGHAHCKSGYHKVFEDIVEEHGWKLPHAVEQWEELHNGNEHEKILTEAAHRVTALLPMVEEMIDDEWSADERRKFRAKCGEGVVYRLKNVLSALCSEKGREILMPSSALMYRRP